VDAPAGELDEEEHVQPLQRDGLDGEEIDRENASRLRPQKGTPRQSGALAGGAESGLPQNRPHRGRRDRDAQTAQLADDPLVAQRGFSPARRSTNSRISPPIGGRPLRPLYVQRLATSRRCHRSSVVGVTKNERQLDRGSSRLAAARRTRSADDNLGRSACRRRTASSCRSTTISSSLKSSERGRSDTSWSTQRSSR
jgi:hypothetical protein